MTILLRVLVLVAAWVVLTEGQLASLWVGVPVIVVALAASRRLAAQGVAAELRLAGLARFAVYFVAHSLRGGFDVAMRALDPRLPLAPALLEYPLRLPRGPARVFLANATSLMPGTLSTALEADRLCIHVLDQRAPVVAQLRVLEARVARLYGVALAPPPRRAAQG
jgi:multicomponent Na+:H+ antiporter subunit E